MTNCGYCGRSNVKFSYCNECERSICYRCTKKCEKCGKDFCLKHIYGHEC